MNNKRKVIPFLAVFVIISSVWIPSAVEYLSNYQVKATSEEIQPIDEHTAIASEEDYSFKGEEFSEEEIETDPVVSVIDSSNENVETKSDNYTESYVSQYETDELSLDSIENSNDVMNRNLATSPLFVGMNSSGIPTTNTHLIPDEIIFANNFVGRTLLNGIPAELNTPLRVGDVITFENITGDLNNIVNAEHSVLSVTGPGTIRQPLLNNNVFNIDSSVGSLINTGLTLRTRYINGEGKVINTPVWTSYTGPSAGGGTIDVTFPLASVNFITNTRSDAVTWGTRNGNLELRQVDGMGSVPFNIVTTGEITWSANFRSLALYRQHGVLLDLDFSNLSVAGQDVEDTFTSQYNISQTIPAFTNNDVEILVDNPDILKGDEVNILAITDNQGNNLIDLVDVSQSEYQTRFAISADDLVLLRRNTLNIALEYPINKEKNVADYLVGDQLEIGVKASNSRSSIVAEGTALTWARPWGEPVPQEVGIDTSTSALDPATFVQNLENKLEGDEPFTVGFTEEQTFDTFGESSVSVIIESAISGVQNTIDVPINVVENKGSVFVHHVDKEGATLALSDELIGIIGEAYETSPKSIDNYKIIEYPSNGTGLYEKDPINVTYVYDIAPVLPVDPLYPEIGVDPENRPEIPENQGLLSIDFVSQFDFGSQGISVQDQTYYAQPQRLLNEDGTVNEQEERPNYIQVSDRRSADERGGWQLAVTQMSQFTGNSGQELNGAQLRLTNQELATAQGGNPPSLQVNNPLALIPGSKRTLIRAEGDEGSGTWVYRFGNRDTSSSSVSLEVPKGSNPEATQYTTTLTWELSAVPGN